MLLLCMQGTEDSPPFHHNAISTTYDCMNFSAMFVISIHSIHKELRRAVISKGPLTSTNTGANGKPRIAAAGSLQMRIAHSMLHSSKDGPQLSCGVALVITTPPKQSSQSSII